MKIKANTAEEYISKVPEERRPAFKALRTAILSMGLYADPELLSWFQEAYPKHAQGKLNMGKSCVRFKKMEDIPFDLIGKLVSKRSAEEWITIYEKYIKR